MPSTRRTWRLLLLTALLVTCAAPTTAAAARPLRTAIVDDSSFLFAPSPQSFARARSAGTTAVRITVYWSLIERRQPIDRTNPSDTAYDWTTLDAAIRAATTARFDVILTVAVAPESGYSPIGDGRFVIDPPKFGGFARAAARRYSGTFEGLPRVRYWQAWNEPNITLYFRPQFLDGQPFSPGHYRKMVNAFATAVKSVHADNMVVAGGTAPFRDISADVQAINPRWGPLTFMREFLCLNANLTRKCNDPVRFDVWAHHPYTSGGPTHTAVLPDDVSLGDLPEMRRVLNAGVRAGNVVPGSNVQFWVTEFSWDSSPPDPKGVPAALHARWVAEALYRMWSNGVSLVTWFQLRDDPVTASFHQSGLYYRGATPQQDRPKPALTAFRFPLVGLPSKGGTYVWGRTPAGRPGKVIVEQMVRGRSKRLAVLQADRYGIFQRRFVSRPVGSVRARLLGRSDRSLAFSLKPVKDRFFNPFGQQTILEGPP